MRKEIAWSMSALYPSELQCRTRILDRPEPVLSDECLQNSKLRHVILLVRRFLSLSSPIQ